MQKIMFRMIVVGCFALIAGLLCAESTYAQLRVPTTTVAALASRSDDGMSALDSETVPAAAQVTPIQHVVPSQVQPQATLPQQIAPPPVMPQVLPQQTALPQTISPPVMVPDGLNGVIVIPVVVPQYMPHSPPPVTMTANGTFQPMVPQYPAPMVPMPPPMMPMYDPMTMQMMQSQMMMQHPVMPMMQQPVMPPQTTAQQPIPVKMILPDGSTVSIKHYLPGQFFKNFVRAVTP